MKEGGHKPTEHVVSIWPDMILVVWWISVIWLLLALVYMSYLLIQWALLKGDPLRYETAIVSAYAALLSIPAGLGVIVAVSYRELVSRFIGGCRESHCCALFRGK